MNSRSRSQATFVVESPRHRGASSPPGASTAELLARRAVLALHEPRVGEETLDALEACDVVDLVEDRERQDLANARNRAKPVVGLGVVLLGPALEVKLQVTNDVVVLLDQREVDLHALAGVGLGEGLGNALAIGLVGDLRRGHGQVVLVVGVLDVGEQVASSTDEVQSPAKQVASGSHLGRVDVGLGERPAAQQRRDLEGIDLVVLGLPAVDGLHVQSVAKHELDPFPAAEVRQPVPGEHALDGDDEVVAVGRDRLEERFGTAPHVLVEEDLALPVEKAQIHGLRVQIAPAVVLVAFVVESHGSLLKRLVVNAPTSLRRVA